MVQRCRCRQIKYIPLCISLCTYQIWLVVDNQIEYSDHWIWDCSCLLYIGKAWVAEQFPNLEFSHLAFTFVVLSYIPSHANELD